MKYWISVNLNKFFESFNLMFWSLIASCKNCSKSSYSAVYDFINFLFLLIHAFSRAKNVSMRLKSDEYEDKRAKMISTASHIWMSSSFQWIRALFRIKIDLHMSIELASHQILKQKTHLRLSSMIEVHCDSIWFRTKSLKIVAVMLF